MEQSGTHAPGFSSGFRPSFIVEKSRFFRETRLKSVSPDGTRKMEEESSIAVLR